MSLTLFFVSLLGFIYYKSLVTMKHRLMLIESIDDLGADISDMRRAEKNYMLYHDQNSSQKWIMQIDLISSAIKEKTPEMIKLEGKQYCIQLKRSFDAYATLARKLVSTRDTKIDEEKIRRKGRMVYASSRNMIRMERRQIDVMASYMFRVFLISISIMIFTALVSIIIIARDIIRPLTRIERATRKVSEGNYVPLTGVYLNDEIGKLAKAFNYMIRQIEKHQEELVQAGKLASLGTLTSGVAHEINNPINNISMMAQAGVQLYDDMDDMERIDLLSKIDKQCKRTRDIVDNLLDFSRVRPRTFESTPIDEVIYESIQLVSNQLIINNIKYNINIEPDLPEIFISRNRIKQVLINIYTNAVKAMPNSGQLDVEVALSRNKRFVNITITDSGVGIPPSVQMHIFDPFFTTSEVGKGTGLGLSVSYSIIKRHGGTITVRSEQDKGSTFTISIPINNKETKNGNETQDSCS